MIFFYLLVFSLKTLIGNLYSTITRMSLLKRFKINSDYLSPKWIVGRRLRKYSGSSSFVLFNTRAVNYPKLLGFAGDHPIGRDPLRTIFAFNDELCKSIIIQTLGYFPWTGMSS